MSSISTPLRRQLENAIKQARKIAAGGARKALEALAVHEPDPYRHMDAAQRGLRKKLRAEAKQLGDGESNTKRGSYEIKHLVEKLAYDQWHRLLFARFLLENNLLISPEHGVSVSLDDCEELAPSLGLKDAWSVAARFAAKELPEIFRADDPAGAVDLPVEDRNPLIQLVTGLPVEVFTASDSLGWCYQFWQAERKDEVNAAGNKIGADELPAVTQLFTEDYMVDFLLDNTLGAWWAGKRLRNADCGMRIESETQAREALALPGCPWKYLRFVPTKDASPQSAIQNPQSAIPWSPAAGTFDGWPKTARELKCLDPCMGSGHFIVALFERLVALRMAEEGLSAREACDAVLRENLFGLELDPRCTQIAAFALAMAAWKYPAVPSFQCSVFSVQPGDRPIQTENRKLKTENYPPLGYRILPPLNLACTGIGPQATEEEWLKLAEQSGLKMNVLSREPILNGLRNLHELFSNAPTLGSLIDPNQLAADLLTADYETLEPFLSAAESSHHAPRDEPASDQSPNCARVPDRLVTRSVTATFDDTAHERAVAAAGMVKAAELLAGQYTLVITNVPYLGRGKQDDTLKQHLEQHYPHSKADLATAFVERCLEFCAKDGTTALVTPQNWLFLTTYTKLRESLLKQQTWNLVARLGPGAFETIGGEVVNAALVTLSVIRPIEAATMAGIDVSAAKEPLEKAASLRGESTTDIAVASQAKQLQNPDCRVVIGVSTDNELLSANAHGVHGLGSKDSPYFFRQFWEVAELGMDWELLQTTVERTRHYGGAEQIVFWQQGRGILCERGKRGEAILAGAMAWGKPGVQISQTGNLAACLALGDKFDKNAAVVLPHDPNHLLPVWCFCSSDEFAVEVRRIDQSLKVTNVSLVKVPFDLAYWQQVALEKYPDGLPEPESDDPTQWLFHGRPESSTAPHQVAVARLLGYRWPAELDSARARRGSPDPAEGSTEGLPPSEETYGRQSGSVGDRPQPRTATPMRLSARARELVQRCDELLSFADADGIVCLSATKGEVPAAERLRALLAQALGNFELSALLASAGPKGEQVQALEEWLRDEFFEQHCALFHQRPFLWHIWDGHKSGFSALVNYHKLDHANLEKLTYAYLGDWIRRQQAAVAAEEAGSDAKLQAAKQLQATLKLILEGEPPFDIFVRWKPLSEQAIGWHPDLNDGVRMNIRPFLAQDIPGGKRGAGILRTKPNIKWQKDRGKEPQRDKAEFPWFWNGSTFTGDRVNDIHLTKAEKREQRNDAAKGH